MLTNGFNSIVQRTVSIPRKGLEVLVRYGLSKCPFRMIVSIPRKGLEVLVPVVSIHGPQGSGKFQSLGRG